MTESTTGLLDTSVVILLPQLRDRGALPATPTISTITLAELGVGPLMTSDPVVQAQRQAELSEASALFEPIPFDTAAARSFPMVAASMRQRGRKPAARSFDAAIAAIALSRGLPLYTCNPQDFSGIDGLTVIAIPHPEAGGPAAGD